LKTAANHIHTLLLALQINIKRLLILTTILIWHVNIYSQIFYKTFDYKLKRDIQFDIFEGFYKSKLFSESTCDYHSNSFFTKSEKILYYFLQDSNFNVKNVQYLEIKDKELYSKYIGFLKTDTFHTLYFISENNNQLSRITIDYLKDTIYADKIELYSSEKLFHTGFNFNNALYLITSYNNGFNIVFYKISGNKLDTFNFNLDTSIIFKTDYEKTYHILSYPYRISQQEISVIKPNEYLSLNTFDTKKIKLYCYENSFILSIENKNKVYLVEMDMKNRQIRKFAIGDDNNEIYGKYTSFLIQERLFIVETTEKELILKIFDARNGKFIREYSFNSKDESIEFANGNPTKQVPEQSVDIETRLLSTKNISPKVFLKEINNNDIEMICNSNDDNIDITIGSSNSLDGTSGKGVMLGQDGIISTTQITFHATAGTYQTKTIQYYYFADVFFRVRIDSSDNPVKNTIIKDHPIDNIREYLFTNKSSNPKIQGPFIIRKEGYYLLCYFNTNEGRFYLYKFN
jgi:hypothetical protein